MYWGSRNATVHLFANVGDRARERQGPMRSLVGVGATVIAGAVALGVTGTAVSKAQTDPPPLVAVVRGTAQTAQGSVPHAFLELQTWPDSMAGPHGADGGAHPDWVTYGPSTNLVLPAHSLVTITIKQYDTGEEITNHYFAEVHGTADGTETVDGKVVTGVDPTAIGHTFTLHSLAQNGQDELFVNAPLPAVADDAPALENGYPQPHVVTFSFLTKGPGEYVFNCEFPCGDGTYAKFGDAMSTRGYMSGTVTVKA